MCLILFAWNTHPQYPLIVAANREEFHQRPTAAAGFWDDRPDLLAGRDLQAGGTWLGVSRSGRFAAITNYREPVAPASGGDRSRGYLVRDFLDSNDDPGEHAARVSDRGKEYQGFNLLLGAGRQLAYVSNKGAGPLEVEAGVHGLSNHLLDTDWPKVHEGRARLAELIDADGISTESLLDLLTDRTLTPGDIPPEPEEGLVPELLTRHFFIVHPVYGTRSSTVVLAGRDGRVRFVERQFSPSGEATGTRRFDLRGSE